MECRAGSAEQAAHGTNRLKMYCRSRLYSFGAVRPFLHYSQKVYPFSDPSKSINIDITEQTRVLESGGYLLERSHHFINDDCIQSAY